MAAESLPPPMAKKIKSVNYAVMADVTTYKEDGTYEQLQILLEQYAPKIYTDSTSIFSQALKESLIKSLNEDEKSIAHTVRMITDKNYLASQKNQAEVRVLLIDIISNSGFSDLKEKAVLSLLKEYTTNPSGDALIKNRIKDLEDLVYSYVRDFSKDQLIEHMPETIDSIKNRLDISEETSLEILKIIEDSYFDAMRNHVSLSVANSLILKVNECLTSECKRG